MKPPLSTAELMKLAGGSRPNKTDPAQWGGKLNIYVCEECCSHIVTRDIAEGVTPFMLPSYVYCPKKCGGRDRRVVMTSSMYRVWDQSMREDYEWYRPAPGEAYDPAYREHVEKGGLIIRPAAKPEAPIAAGKEQKLLVAMAPPAGSFGVPTLVLGVPSGAWDYMKDGKTHTLDLTKLGIPAQMIMFGAKDHAECVSLLEQSAASVSMPEGDLPDLGIQDPTKQ